MGMIKAPFTHILGYKLDFGPRIRPLGRIRRKSSSIPCPLGDLLVPGLLRPFSISISISISTAPLSESVRVWLYLYQVHRYNVDSDVRSLLLASAKVN